MTQRSVGLTVPSTYVRVAEEEQAEDRVGSEQVNEGPAETPARQREHSKPRHHQEDGVGEGEFATLRRLHTEQKTDHVLQLKPTRKHQKQITT